MSRTLKGALGRSLVDVLDIRSGQIALNQVRDQEGIGFVWDLNSTAAADLLVTNTRGFDTGLLGSAINNQQTIGSLPRLAHARSIDVATDDPTRLSWVYGAFEENSVAGRRKLVWLWENGDPTWDTGGATIAIGDAALQFVLLPTIYRMPYTYVNGNDGPNKVGDGNMIFRTLTTAFGAGTVRVTGQVDLEFYIGLGGRSNPVALPGW